LQLDMPVSTIFPSVSYRHTQPRYATDSDFPSHVNRVSDSPSNANAGSLSATVPDPERDESSPDAVSRQFQTRPPRVHFAHAPFPSFPHPSGVSTASETGTIESGIELGVSVL
jgi:hypothetical protein